MFDSYMTLEEVEEIKQVIIPAGSSEDKCWDALSPDAKLRSVLLATNLLENTLCVRLTCGITCISIW